jgi:biotin transport system substrate-specific component
MTISMPRLDRLPAQERGLTIGDFLVPIRVSERLHTRARHLALILIGTAVIAVSARIAVVIPGNPVPFTAQTFGVLLAAGALGFRRGLAASLLYVALGTIGLPVFAEGKHGLAILLGPSGGYLIGIVLASGVVGRLAELGWDRSLLGGIGAMLLGGVAINLVRVPWLAITSYGGDLYQGYVNGLLPYLPWDAVNIVPAAAAFPAAWWFVGRRPGDR